MKSFLRRHRWRLVVAAVFVALAVNVAIHDGIGVLIVLLLAGLGCVVAVAIPAYISGASAVRHSMRERQAIESGKHPAKELTR